MTSSQPRVIESKRTGRLSHDQKAVHMQHNAVFRGERQISFICFPLSVAFGDFQSQAQTIFYLGIVAFRYRVFIKYCFFPKIFKIYSGLWPLSVSPRWCQKVYTMADQKQALQQKLHNILRKNTIFNEHPVIIFHQLLYTLNALTY